MVRKVCIDAGNTRIKWRFGADPVVSGSYKELLNALEGMELEQVVLASVRGDDLLQELTKILPAKIHIIKVCPIFNDFMISYADPSKLGVDRWLNMLAAHQRVGNGTCLVVSSGTAITIDAIHQGHHLGGYILPGLALQAKALALHTARLPEVGVNDMVQSGFANNTLSAIAAGIADSVRALVVSSVESLNGYGQCRLIITGGDGETLSKSLQIPVDISEELIFEGIDVYWNSVCRKHEI